MNMYVREIKFIYIDMRSHTHNHQLVFQASFFFFEVRPSKISCGTLQSLLPLLQPLQPLQMDVSSPGDIQILAARVT